MAAGGQAELAAAMSGYARSCDAALPLSMRFHFLAASYAQFKRNCEGQPPGLRLASLARVAADYGERATAVNALQQLSYTIIKNQHVELGEPFLVPAARFDAISPGNGAIDIWVLAAVLEQLEVLESFSSFYSGSGARQRLEVIVSLGFASAEMHRRLHLLKSRFSQPVEI
jgi:hypothetical protein